MLTVNEIVGKNILHVLKEKDLSQNFLAEQIGTSKQMIHKIIHGRKNITIDEIITISKALDVQIERLVQEPKEESIEPIRMFLGQVTSQEARDGLLHLEKAMDMIIFHSDIREKKEYLQKEWDE